MDYGIIIAAIVGLLTGAIGSLIAPWVNWGIEKKKLRHQKKVELLNQVKSYISSPEFERKDFVNSPNYIQIKRHLSLESIKHLETHDMQPIVVVPNDPVIKSQHMLLNDIVNLEEKWGII